MEFHLTCPLYCKAHTIDEATVCLQNNLNELSKWLDSNKLVVNASKSQIMLVGSRKYVENKIIKVAIGNTYLTKTSNVTLLGVNINSQLSWNLHVESISKQISPKVGLLHRFSRFLPSNVLQTLYIPLVQSYIDYAITVWF